jgi:hypothetical protein
MRTPLLPQVILLALCLALSPRSLARADAEPAAPGTEAAASREAASPEAASPEAASPEAASPEAASPEAASPAAETRPSFRERLREQARQPGATQLLTSLISSVGFGPELLWGGGLQLRLDHYPSGLPLRFGGFVQSEMLTDGAVRVAGGLQGGAWMMGCQLGLAFRSASDRYWSTLGIQIGKSIDFGIFSIGGRVVIPVAEFVFGDAQSAPLTSTGIEGAVFMSVGLPTLLEGERRGCGCPHGRDDEADGTE